MRALETLDEAQRRHKRASIAVATYKRYSEDKSANLATMIAFWAFFGIFPLLLVLVTLLGWILSGSDKASVLGHVAQLFPLLDPKTVNGLSGSVWAVIVLGLATALWSGLASCAPSSSRSTRPGESRPTNGSEWPSRCSEACGSWRPSASGWS